MRVAHAALFLLAIARGCEVSAQDASLPRPDADIPAENRRDLRAPPARPGEADELGRRLFAAIVHDQPERAADDFFPRAAFLQVKAMAHPQRYYERLYRRYEADVHKLHRETKDLSRAEFVRLELGKRGGWVRIGEEGNRLPYWAARHALLHYRVGREARTLEVRVLITWGPHWYLIHLSEFH